MMVTKNIDYSTLCNQLQSESTLRDKEYYLLALDCSTPETALLRGGIRVAGNGDITPLHMDTEVEPQPDEEPEIAVEIILGETSRDAQIICVEADEEEQDTKVPKRLSPEATILDGAERILSYHLNRTRDGLMDLRDYEKHDVPIVYYNVGTTILKVDSEKISGGAYLVHTTETLARAAWKSTVAAHLNALNTSPEVVAEIEEIRQEVYQKLHGNSTM